MISNTNKWNEYVEKNRDSYGKTCVDTARCAMELMDKDFKDRPITKNDVHGIICDADTLAKAGGITGFMAGAVAYMISECYSRGKEFLTAWNKHNQIGDEGEKATKKGAVLNPALVTIET